MPYFIKKPIQIEARQYDGRSSSTASFIKWIVDNGNEAFSDPFYPTWFFIETLEGTQRVAPNDWVIRDVAGDFYPCNPDIFAVTYEPVNN